MVSIWAGGPKIATTKISTRKTVTRRCICGRRGGVEHREGTCALESGSGKKTLPKALFLELFARELRQFWHAAGNEVLRFQRLDLYVERTETTD